MYCRDLLGKDIKKKLDLKEHPDRGVYVSDITLHPVHNTQVGSLCTSPYQHSVHNTQVSSLCTSPCQHSVHNTQVGSLCTSPYQHSVHDTQVGSLCTSPALTRYAYITNISMLVV